jgi:hypothetical protein
MSRARTVVTERLGRTRLAQIERHAAALSPPQVLDAALDAITGQLARLGRSIVDRQTGLCLDVSGGGTPPNATPVVVWPCTAKANQRWSRS